MIKYTCLLLYFAALKRVHVEPLIRLVIIYRLALGELFLPIIHRLRILLVNLTPPLVSTLDDYTASLP